METAERQKESERQFQASKAEYDRKFQEEQAEYDRKFQEEKAEYDKRQEKLDAQMKELSANVGGVNNSLGDMAEGLMASDLYESFKAHGLDFNQFTGNYKLKEKKTGRTLTEVDMLLVNGTIAMAVEVKTTMTEGDVDKHETRMNILRRESNSLFANRDLYGAMAGVKMSKVARQYAIDKGFYVIELTGDTIKVDMPEGWEPKTW
jgi:TPP-dependent indolepyruvate ferredoxin oxidoreductase alpha subunit